jgi:phosphoesterase RecJ-like protein
MNNDISPIVREKAPLILAEIKKANTILLHCHPSPDPDSVGSALAMKFALEQIGKKVTVIKGDSEIPQAFMHFPGAAKIVQKNFSEIRIEDFDMFLIVDAGSPGMISQLKTPAFPLPTKTIVIDHHASNTSFADINLIDLSSPSTAYILFQLCKEWNISLTRDIALNLFIGMYTDTGGFKYPPTDYRIFNAAAELVKIVPDYTKCIFVLENSEQKSAIYFSSAALNSIETFCDEHVVIAAVTYDTLKEKNISLSAIGGDSIANRLKSVIGWDIGIMMIETEPNNIKISMRTRDPERFDVSKLATALGGGGHRAAAGIKMRTSLADAKKLVVAKAKELYNL